jgi:hypothetical protein
MIAVSMGDTATYYVLQAEVDSTFDISHFASRFEQ